MQKPADYILFFLLDKDEPRSVSEEQLRSIREWVKRHFQETDALITQMGEITNKDVALKIAIQWRLNQLLQDSQFSSELEVFLQNCQVFFEKEEGDSAIGEAPQSMGEEQPDKTNGMPLQKNTISDSVIRAGGDVAIGDYLTIYINETSKKLELNCPKCGTEAPARIEFDKKDGTHGSVKKVQSATEFICLNCEHRFYAFHRIFEKTSDYRGLTPRQSASFNHLSDAIANDLRLRHNVRAYERCEDFKAEFGSSAPIYGYCALTYFYSTDIDDIIHESARKIIIYLEDSQKHDANWAGYHDIARTIAWGYSNAIREYMEFERQQAPQKRVPAAKDEKLVVLEEYRQALTKYASNLLRILDEYETCYRIYPLEDFLEEGVLELCGHKGTPWFNLSFKSMFIKPQSYHVEGYVWDYYDFASNTWDFENRVDDRPKNLLTLMLTQLYEINPAYTQPKMRIGATVTNAPTSINSHLLKVAIMFWAIVLTLIVYGYSISPWIGVLCTLAIALLIYFKKRVHDATLLVVSGEMVDPLSKNQLA